MNNYNIVDYIENHIKLIKLENGDKYVKKTPDWDYVSVSSEPYIIDIVKENTSIPVPKVIYREPDEPMFIMNYIDGESLPHSENLDIGDLLEICEIVGGYIGQLHSVEFDRVGQLVYNSGLDVVPAGGGMDFESYFRTELHNYESQAISNGFDIYLPIDLSIPEPDRYVMNPIDFHTGNIIVNNIDDDITVNGVVDFERVYSGHPRWGYEQTLYMLEKDRTDKEIEQIRDAFEYGYNKHRETPQYHKVFRIACVLREMRASHIWYDEVTEDLIEKLKNKYNNIL